MLLTCLKVSLSQYQKIVKLTLQAPTPQNCQTHSNNSSAAADVLFEFV